MNITQPRVIDWLGLEKETGHVVLTVIDDVEWTDEPQHLLMLQEKLNTYIAFVESGEVFERLAADVGRPVASTTPIKVSILAKYEQPPRAQAFMAHAIRTFADAGVGLSCRVVRIPD